MIGGGARAMLTHGLEATGGYDDAMLDTLHRQLLDYYEAHLAVHTAPFPGRLPRWTNWPRGACGWVS